jgi:hypothetical protein
VFLTAVFVFHLFLRLRVGSFGVVESVKLAARIHRGPERSQASP